MSVRERIVSGLATRQHALEALARRLHAHPELRFAEHQAAAWLAEAVEGAGLAVERGVGGLETALRARAGRAGGARVALLAEYDALPELGHACGHNLIAGAAVGAFLALAALGPELPGEVILLGTPAEEGGGGKIKLLAAGAFAGLDAAMMFHPFDRDVLALPTLASAFVTLAFAGRPAHAAAAPWDGRSALQGVIQTFNLVDSQRLHFRDGARVHGIITDGGQAVNVVPERAVSEWSVRARSARELAEVLEIVTGCARAAALATRTEVTVTVREGYRDLRNNLALARRFGAHLAALGRSPLETDPEAGLGSTDMGDVSHAVPAIHPYVAICARGAALCHERAFALHAASDDGMHAMLDAAAALALTAFDLLADGGLRAAVRQEFERNERAQPLLG